MTGTSIAMSRSKFDILPEADSRLPCMSAHRFHPARRECGIDIEIEMRRKHGRVWYDAVARDLSDRVAACVKELCEAGVTSSCFPNSQ